MDFMLDHWNPRENLQNSFVKNSIVIVKIKIWINSLFSCSAVPVSCGSWTCWWRCRYASARRSCSSRPAAAACHPAASPTYIPGSLLCERLTLETGPIRQSIHAFTIWSCRNTLAKKSCENVCSRRPTSVASISTRCSYCKTVWDIERYLDVLE